MQLVSQAEKLLLTPKQAALAMSISERKLWSMTKSAEIPHLRFGRSVRYSLESLQALIAERQQGGG